MPPEPLESSRAREAGPPVSTTAPHSAHPPQSDLSERDPRSDSGRPARLEALLCDLGAQVRRGGALRPEPARLAHYSTGLADLDVLIGGGFPAGRICEISGPPSSGRTSLALALLAQTTRTRGELVAFVDPADAFDPASAEAAGAQLDCVLWVRPAAPIEALRCVECLMQTGGLPLVFLDLSPPSPAPARDRPAAASPRRAPLPRRRPGTGRPQPRRQHANPALHHWIRLARLAETTRTSLIVLSHERMTGSQAEIALEARSLRVGFGGPPHLLARVETEVALVRTRNEPGERSVALRLEADGGPAP